MTAAGTSSAPSPEKAGNKPDYEFGRRETELIARFRSGKRVAVLRGRERTYPGLRSVAPSTLPFYQLFAPLIAGRHVVDAGSGSGVGTQLLCDHVPHVTALDNDARALEFSREYAPNAEYLQADLCHGSAVDLADAAILVDVLGHVASPDAVLHGLRACMPIGAQLFVAEPKAYGSQRLLAPAGRAFSQRALQRILLRSGFELETTICDAANFVALVGRRSDDVELAALVEGFQQARRGQFCAARTEFTRASHSSRHEIKLEALLGAAEAAFDSNDGDGAVRCYFEANTLDPSDGRALAGLARVALATGELEDAVGLSIDAIKREPTESAAHASMAIAAEQLGRPEAFNSWLVAVNLAPNDLSFATGLARTSAARGSYAFAIQVFERLRSYGSVLGPDFHVTLGWMLLADGRRNDAGVEARYAAAIAPDEPGVAELVAAVTAH
jgi:Flp pilus assembly protein TadD/2-polyprenyl-3-methyl-5-hydroxy-6-metoxy-1,4-benzoquinol methylase